MTLVGCATSDHSSDLNQASQDLHGKQGVPISRQTGEANLADHPRLIPSLDSNSDPDKGALTLHTEKKLDVVGMPTVTVEARRLAPYVIFGQQNMDNPDYGPLFLVPEGRSGGRGEGILWAQRDLSRAEILSAEGTDVRQIPRVEARQLIANLPEPFRLVVKTPRDGIREVVCFWTKRELQ